MFCSNCFGDSDVTVLRLGLTEGLAGALPSLVIAVGGFIYLFTLSWQLTLVMCVAIPVVLLIVRFFGSKISDAANAVQKAIAVSTAEVFQPRCMILRLYVMMFATIMQCLANSLRYLHFNCTALLILYCICDCTVLFLNLCSLLYYSNSILQ